MTTGDTGAAEAAVAAHDDAKHHHVDVHVLYVDDLKKVSFKEPVDKTLQLLWDKSYVKLEVEKKPKDVFQTGGEHPKSLMSHLSLTLKQAHEQKVIENWHFGIASEKGGA